MKLSFLAASAAFALSACGGSTGDNADGQGNLAASGNSADVVALPGNEAAAAGQTAPSAQQYVELAGGSDLFEIQSSRIALEKAQRSEVRELAQMLVTDHERSTRDLTSAAQQAQPRLGVAPQLTAEQQSNLAALRQATGANFDQVYLDQQVAAHQKALTLVTAFAQSGDVPSLRQHATTVSGPIQQHLERARQLHSAR
jgi:putative membrane protein